MEMEKPEEEAPRLPPTTMEDLPPEVLTKILEFVVTLDGKMFGCRLVNSQWKGIMDSLIEKSIVTREFPVFPKMNIVDVDDKLQVLLSPKFRPVINAFSFNSLHFNGTSPRYVPNNETEGAHFPMLSLPTFVSTFGGNLTTFSIQHQVVPMNTLITMLNSMSNLKCLRLQGVWVEDGPNIMETGFPLPPPLPCLTILELTLPFSVTQFPAFVSRIPSNHLIIWLMASYADQLECLALESGGPIPPLQTSHTYTYETRVIATTSESAFKNLKELKVCCPSREFLLLSETPALQRLSVVDSYFAETNFELEDVITFINNCGRTLETLVLNNVWIMERWMSEEETRKFLDGRRPQRLRASLVEFSQLKTIKILYPHMNVHEMILTEFILKFPTLKSLQFLNFRLHHFDEGIPIEGEDQHQMNERNQNADEIAALKKQLNPLLERMFVIWNKKRLAELALREVQQEFDPDQLQQRRAEIEGLDHDMTTAREERVAIFNRLAALGENTRMVMVEQFLERGDFWNAFPRLGIVSVSSAELPNGDVCLVRRPEQDA